VIVDVLADSSDAAPARLLEAIEDPAAAEAMLGGGKAERLFAHAYRQIVSLPSALAAYRVLFVDLGRPERRPALFHCTTGKDRTGWAAAAMLMLLGVSDEDVMRDYLLTNDQLLPRLQPLFDRFAAAGGDPTLLQPVLGVRREYLDASLDEMRGHYGSIERYFADGLGVDETAQDALRSAFIEPRPA
jgi:protein-tyrosine phosphatase